MASITKHKDGWRAFIYKKGTRTSKTFKTKAEAKSWAVKIENELNEGSYVNDAKVTLSEAIDRYLETVSPLKKSHNKEVLRLNSFKSEFSKIANKSIIDVKSSDISRWRDKRLQEVTQGTVRREANILKNLFNIACREWGWVKNSPFDTVKMPSDPAPRTRRISPREVKAICRYLGYVSGVVETKSQEVALAFLISLRTAMRAGEVLSLNARRADLESRVLTVPHKTQHITGRERKIPITRQGSRLINVLNKRGEYFTISSASLSTLFRRATRSLAIEDLHFHDARAEALTRLSRKVDVMTLAKISGHSDLRILQNTYYRETAADIAKRL